MRGMNKDRVSPRGGCHPEVEFMKLIVGLGNPGEKYEYTRHNAGFLMIQAFVASLTGDGVVWLDETKFKSHVFRLKGDGGLHPGQGDTRPKVTPEAIFAKPQTFMNESGEAVSKLRDFYKVELSDILVIHDDVDLEFGDVRVKKGGGSAGHHGIESIVEKLGSVEFVRLRVGVGRPEDKRFDIEDYVLQRFSEEELVKMKEVFDGKVRPELVKFL